MKRLVLFSYLLNILTLGNSQSKIGNNWYFGRFAGLTFNSGSPQLLTGSLLTGEGSATISDRNGNLLFYTDGITVYNRNHGIMPNGTGLTGNHSSTSSAIIIPKPGDPNRYFIFTADAVETNLTLGYRYSEVDMTLNGGLGDVTNKNILLYIPATEKLAAVKHADGVNYWVITKEYDNNRFRVFKVDCNGVNPSPVITDIGFPHQAPPPAEYTAAIGQMKVSPDGKKIAVAMAGVGNAGVQLFNFDNNTGVLSNAIAISGNYYQIFLGQNLYGVEFSPDSRLLYISSGASNIWRGIEQLDITSNNELIINSTKILHSTSHNHHALQLASDGKIYLSRDNQGYLSILENPNVYGNGLVYTPDFPLTPNFSYSGLPSIISNCLISTPLSIADFTFSFIDCHVQFSGSSNLNSNLKWFWSFGDGTIDSSQSVRHSYRNGGTYSVTLKIIATSTCGASDSFTVSKPIIVNNAFSVDFTQLGNCSTQPSLFSDNTSLNVGNITGWEWDFGDGSNSSNQNSSHVFAVPGAYDVKLVVGTSGICRADSISKIIFIDARPVASFHIDNGCVNQVIQYLDLSSNVAGGIITNWKWQFGDGNSASTPNTSHSYSASGNFATNLIVSTIHGCTDDSVGSITVEDYPIADFVNSAPCLNQAVNFSDRSTIGIGNITNWQWDFGNSNNSNIQNPAFTFTPEGDFPIKLTVYSTYGCQSNTKIIILPIRKVNANAGPDTIAIYGQPIQLHGSGGTVYQWTPTLFLNNPFIPDPIAKLTSDQTFKLQVTTSQGCVGIDEVKISVVNKFDIYVPSAFTPNNDGKNDFLIPFPVGIKQIQYFKIFNRWGQEIFSTNQLGEGWDGKCNKMELSSDLFVWIIKAITISGDVIEKNGTCLLIR